MEDDISLEELQEQFKKIQQKTTSNKLSERNCVEIIMKLIQLGLIQVLFTLNGREYLTQKQLEREIYDELLRRGGRINIVEIPPILNLDFQPVQQKIFEIIKKDKQLQLIDGELINHYYIENICEEINDTLQKSGEITLEKLSRRFNLPQDFLLKNIEKRIGKSIKGKLLDSSTLYTDTYVQRQTQRISGIFSAITKPTFLSSLMVLYEDLQEQLFYKIVDQLIQSERINGIIQGKHDGMIFIPKLFNEARINWINSFFNQNQYIDYKNVEKFFYSNPKSFLENKFGKVGIALSTCFINRQIIDQVDSICSESIQNNSWVDISSLSLPSCLTISDISSIIKLCPSIIQIGKFTNCIVFHDHYVVSKGMIDRFLKLYEQYIKEMAEKGLLPKKSETNVKSELFINEQINQEMDYNKGNKKGNKKIGKKKKDQQQLSNKHKEEILLQNRENFEIFHKWFEDIPDNLLESIIEYINSNLNQIKDEVTRSIFIENKDSKQKKKSFQDNFNTIFFNIQLFQKGIQSVQEERNLLEKHLLKTLCNDLINLIIENQAFDHCISCNEIKNLTERNNILNQLPNVNQILLKRLISICSSSDKTTSDFIEELEKISNKLEIQLKYLDKKTEKQFLNTHYQTLKEQLQLEKNPATFFHLIIVFLYLTKYSVMIHIPSKMISTILEKLKPDLNEVLFSKLLEFQNKVIKYLINKQQNYIDSSLELWFNDELPKLKEIILNNFDKK